MLQYKVGDVVKIKSGGPKMTVKDPNGHFGIECQWFAGSKLEHGFFSPETIIKIELDDEGKEKATK